MPVSNATEAGTEKRSGNETVAPDVAGATASGGFPSPPDAPTRSDGFELLAGYFRRPALLLTTLALVTAVLYSGTLSFPFVWDDGPQIVDNPLIRSWHNLSRVFVSDLWYHTARQQVYYRPLFVAWSTLNWAVAGGHPWAWHLGAILLHIGATLSVFWLCRRLGLEYWTAAMAALIFALHPVHIECVAWVSAGSDSMVAMLAALAFSAFLKAREPRTSYPASWRLASLALLACALLTKEMAVSFTPLVGLYVYLLASKATGRWQRVLDAVAAMAPYAALTAAYAVLRKFALWHTTLQMDAQHGYGAMLLTLPYVLAFYLKKLFLPLGLTGLYYTPYISSHIVGQVLGPVLLLGASAGLIYVWAERSRDWLVAFAGCWLLVGLAPALFLRVYGNGDFVRDRYMYLPSIGFAILAAKAIRRLPSIRQWSASAVQACAIVLVSAGYVGASLPQQVYWDSDLLIYARGHELYPDNPYASIGLGREYSHLGANDRAVALVEEAVRRQPRDGQLALALAEVYVNAGRKEEGRKALEYALQAMPVYVESETGAATVAAYWAELGEYDRAVTLCNKVLARDANLYSGLYNCGNIQLLAGNYGAAEGLLRRAVQASPGLAAPRHFLGRALFLEGKNGEAQGYLGQAAALDPAVYDYHYWLARSLQESGERASARREYQAALRINADSAETKLRLAALEGQ
jgi:tetratricopeptide (TPR) repeat protein